LRSSHDSRNAALLAANQRSGARMKTVTVVLIVFFGLVFSSKSAPGRDSNRPSKSSVSVPGIWRYKGGDEKPMEIRFLPDHKVMFKGGYEFYNPAQWSFTPTTAELKLTVPKMKETDFKLFNQWRYAGLRVNPKEKTIVYTLNEPRICFMGYFYEKEEK
jgi:hypothetical protein